MKPTPKTTSKATPPKAAAKTGGDKGATTKAVSAKPAAEKSAGKAAPARKAAPKKAAVTAAATSTSMPLIDTDLAAQNAAAMLLNRPASEGAPSGTGDSAKESATFKNLKDQLANPKPASLSNLFGPSGDQKKSGGHFNLNQQKGHNQTFGGMNKTGVPRRTNG